MVCSPHIFAVPLSGDSIAWSARGGGTSLGSPSRGRKTVEFPLAGPPRITRYYYYSVLLLIAEGPPVCHNAARPRASTCAAASQRGRNFFLIGSRTTENQDESRQNRVLLVRTLGDPAK